MKAFKGFSFWRPVLGVTAMSLFVCSLTLVGAPPDAGRVQDTSGNIITNVGPLLEAGYKIRTNQVPMAPGVQAELASTALLRENLLLRAAHSNDEGFGEIATPLSGGPTGCELNIECDDCNDCTSDECVLEVCVSTNLDACDRCDDGLFCNGVERCDGLGNCLDATGIIDPPADPCANLPGTVCDELADNGNGGCVAPCADDSDCSDASSCNGVETCVNQVCIPGDLPCGRGAPCADDGNGFICGDGRCCKDGTGGAQDCTNETKIACEGSGGRWLGVGDIPGTEGLDFTCGQIAPPSVSNAGEDFQCPKYEAGITSGTLVGSFGVAAAKVDCPGTITDRFLIIGDDYEISNAGTSDFIEVTTVRWIGGFAVGTGSRMRISFYDLAGNLIEDTITGGSPNAGLILRTDIFGEKPVIPSRGIITLQPAVEFSPNSLDSWGVVTGADVNVGVNDVNRLYVDIGAGLVPVTPESLGLPPGSGVVAVEIVGNKVPAPTSACCNPETGVCSEELPWICEAQGGTPQTSGSTCNVCFSNPFVNCKGDEDCRVCIGGDSDGQPCSSDLECPGPGAFCETNPNCTSAPPACQITACCNPADGECTIVQDGGFCSIAGTPCFGDNGCLTGETCEAPCPTGTISQGFGTTCEPNCCLQIAGKEGDAADTCAAAGLNKIIIDVPLPGEPAVTFTFSNNNKLANFGDFTDGTCNLGIFNENGGTRDRGYWHAFSITACADVRLDLCCTKERSGEIHQPQWAFMTTDCNPCTTTVGNSIVGTASVGTNSDPNDRGAPFCDSDDLWQTYRSLPMGTYYHPIYSATSGHFGDYQLHITVGACPLAVCCLPDGTGCAVLNQTDCNTAGGLWHGFGIIPTDIEDINVTCGNFCDIGTCCGAGGTCEDRATAETPCDGNPNGITCMTKALCDTSGGNFLGGATCDWPERGGITPCPACAIEGSTNCQLTSLIDDPFTQFLQASDLAFLPTGVVSADDFIPQSTTIGSICVWGSYLDNNLIESGGLGDEFNGCVGQVQDNFRVRIYADDGGAPGAVVAEVRVTGSDISSDPVPGTDFEGLYGVSLLSYTLTINPPIVLPEANVAYWLEVANDTDALAGGSVVVNTCNWHWAHLLQVPGIGNNYSFMGTDDRPAEEGGGSGYVRNATGARSTDMVFCLGTGSGPLTFTAPETPLGGCCQCDGTCVESQTLVTCDNTLIGNWSLDNNCSTPCEAQAGETCAGIAGGLAGGLDCSVAGGGGGGAIQISDGLFGFDSSCAPTDGPNPVPTAGLDGNLVNDIWYEYTTTCTGKLVISMCPTGNSNGSFDSFLAIYHNDGSPETCPLCPTDDSQQKGVALDEECNGIFNAGPGISSGNIVRSGECWLIRVGGFLQAPGNDAGAGLLDVRCLASDCFPSAPAVQTTLVSTGQSLAKVRHLAIHAGDAGQKQALRVTFSALPPPFDVANGFSMWADQPKEVCQNSGQNSLVSLENCGPTMGSDPNLQGPTYILSKLSCDAFFMDWTTISKPVNIYHEFIVPGATYDIQVIQEDCLLDLEANFSDSLFISTSVWGDTIGQSCITADTCQIPDGVVNVSSDVSSTVEMFKNSSFAPGKGRSDVEPGALDQQINFSDIVEVLNAFSGKPYPFAAPNLPCSGPSTGSK